MGTTQNYGYNVPVGSDNVNLLPDMAANFPMIDSDLKAVSNTGVGTATELVTGTVHALTRADRNRNVFKFVATSNFEAGETFEVDAVQVTAKTPDGRNLSTGAYVINSTVLCMLEGTLLTVLVNPAKALDSENLDGHPATYFATAAALSALDNQLGAVSSKVGTGVLDVGNDCVDGINKLNTNLSDKQNKAWTASNDGTIPAFATECRVRGSIYIGNVNQCITLYMNASDLAFNGRYFAGGHDGQVAFLMIVTNTNRTLTVGQFMYAGVIYPTPTISIEYR